jgi:hypothetical protein
LPTQLIENPNSGGKKSTTTTAKKNAAKTNGAESQEDDVNSAIADSEIAALASETPVTITRLIPDLTRGKSQDERSVLLAYVKNGDWLASDERSFVFDPKTKSVTART